MSEAFDTMRNFTTQHEKDDTPKKFCENCGREISIDAEKCDKCGFSFNLKWGDINYKYSYSEIICIEQTP